MATEHFSIQDATVGTGLNDVPLGRYSISARYVPKDGSAPKKLGIRVWDTGTYADAVTINFEEISIG